MRRLAEFLPILDEEAWMQARSVIEPAFAFGVMVEGFQVLAIVQTLGIAGIYCGLLGPDLRTLAVTRDRGLVWSEVAPGLYTAADCRWAAILGFRRDARGACWVVLTRTEEEALLLQLALPEAG